MMKKTLLTLLAAALLLPLAAVAQQNNYPQFSGDSILFVLVDFPTMQFQYSAAEIENSIADYACNGKRVVGPYHMTGMPSAYNGYSTSFLQFGLDVYDSAATDVDMSHFPFNSSHANMVIVYPGTISAMSQQNTYFGQAGTLFEFSGEDKSLYYTFFSEQAICGGEEQDGIAWYVGDPIWITMLHRTRYIAPEYLFRGGGVSLIERAPYGCATIDTLSEAADSIELKVITGYNDKGYYISLSDDEFLLLEAHAMHDGSSAVANDGMYIFHGSGTAIGQAMSAGWVGNSAYTSLASDEANIYSREYVPFGAHSYPDTTYGRYGILTDMYNGSNNLTPQSRVKPMLFDSTVVTNVWITNIRWKNDTVMLFDFNSNSPVAEISVDRAEMGLTDLVVRGHTLSRIGNITAKGVVYATTEDGCTMSQGIVVYDSTTTTTDIKVRLTGLTHGATYYCRTFVTVGSQTSISPVKAITMDKYVGIRNANINSEISRGLVLDIELDEDIDHCFYYGYLQTPWSSSIEEWPEWSAYTPQVADVSGTTILPLRWSDDTVTDYVIFGMWVVTTDGDTVGEIFKYDTSEIGVVQIKNTSYDIEDKIIVDGVVNIVGRVGIVDQTDSRYWVGVVPSAAYLSALEYYGGFYNYSLAHHLFTNYAFTEVDSTRTISLPVLALDSDSLLLLAEWDQYGVVHVEDWKANVDMRADQAVGEAHLGYENDEDYETGEYGYHETVFTNDSTLRIDIYPNEFANHYYMLHGTALELEALGVTDTATAAAYYLAHQAEMQRYDCPWLFKGFWGNPSVVFTMTINHVQTLTGALPGSDYHVYLFPYNVDGEAGKVERLVFHVKDKFVDVTPGGNGDTAWWYAENGEVIWAWRYDYVNYYDTYNMYLAPLGRVDSLCTAGNVDPVGLLPVLIQAGLTRNYGSSLPWSTIWYANGDTAMHLLPDTTYELCLWATDYDGTVYFQSTLFSTHGAPHFNEAALNDLYFERNTNNGDTVFYCLVQATESTAYYHVIFGEEGALSEQGITSLATAGQYSLSHSSTLEQYTHQTTEIIFGEGTDDMGYSIYAFYTEFVDGMPVGRSYWCWRKHNTQSMSRDSVYRMYVIPYTAAGNQGVGRYIRFSPFYGIYDYSDSAVYGYVTECSVSDITEYSATLHGNIQAGRRSMSMVGFSYLSNDAPSGTEASTIAVGPFTCNSFSYRLTGLQPNTTYRYAVAMGYDTSTSVYSSAVYFNPHTFTTASCTVSASIDTAICYNSYYNNRRYNRDTVLSTTYRLASGCDSVVTVNIHILPQRLGYDTVELCYGNYYYGTNWYSSGSVNQLLSEPGLCDSTVRVQVNVLPEITSQFTDTLRNGSYTWNSEVYTTAGTYTQTLTAANGCDSVVTLRLVPERNTGVDDVATTEVAVYQQDGQIAVDNAQGMEVCVYDAAGRLIQTIKQADTQALCFAVPSSGTYIVTIGGNAVRRVVIVH